MAMSKTKLIEKILAKANNTYSEADCKEMKVAELQDLLTDLNNEEAQPEPELNEEGGIVIPAPIKPLEEPKAPKAPRGESKRDVLYAIFDETHAKGEDLKAAAKAALPETSDGVISSYLCYWRKDRNIVATRSFGNKAAGKTRAEKLKTAIVKLYGEDFDLDVVIAELKPQEEAAEA